MSQEGHVIYVPLLRLHVAPCAGSTTAAPHMHLAPCYCRTAHLLACWWCTVLTCLGSHCAFSYAAPVLVHGGVWHRHP